MSRTIGHKHKVALIRALLVGGAVLVWEVLSLCSTLIASPAGSVHSLALQLGNGSLSADISSTLRSVAYGFLVAVALGVPVGYALGRSRLLAAAFEPVVASLFAIPRIIVYPLLIGILGVGSAAKAWLAVLSAIFPIIIATAGGVKQVPPILGRLGSTLGCSRLKMAIKVVLPAALPPIMGGVRIAFGVSFVTVIIAELFVAASGLGLAVRNAYSQLNIDAMYADILLIVAVAFIGSLILWMVERRLQAAAE